jgi:pilus assembly protein Flp/PilA
VTSRLVRTEDGASSVEYGLVVTAIAALLTVVVIALGGVTLDMFSTSCTQLESKAMTGTGC